MAPVLAPVELESSTRSKHQRPIGAAPAGLQLGLFGLPLARTQNLQLFRKSRHSPTLKNQRSSAFAVRFSLSGFINLEPHRFRPFHHKWLQLAQPSEILNTGFKVYGRPY